ncbi:Hsp70 family protein [Aspergillus melleus]|uniref:Hsp70 family protein n=1 Tax=Aspergillus melleus TaxID=138277 RepID=UPI001E8DA704|nr:lumenal Hsp70 protein [Aspergillus melleus]KAH8432330.1 lumenal Hsp70 protein [Aspergillus melleus]
MASPSRQRSVAPMRLFSSPVLSFLIVPFLVFFLSFPASAAAAGSGVIGIDVGTEYFKAALVKPGIPLEIVLTKDSKRKETAAIAFKPTREANAPFPERFYGGDALALAARYPDDVYANLKILLGLPFENGENEVVKTYHDRYPALKLESAGERGTVGLRSNRLGEAEKKDAFLVEEILAMQLKQIKANADDLAGKGSDIKDAVITYPSFYTAEEKRSLQLAAALAGLNVNAFVTDGLAVGLNYATSRTFPIVSDGQKPEYHVIFDMGAGSTTASVLRFQGRSVKDVGKFNKTIHEIHVLGEGWDRSLGGDSLNDLIVDDMVAALAEDKKLKDRVTVADIKAHGKTMARIRKDAEKVRQVLSANTETGASFESLYEEGLNFKYRITRSKFEELAEQHIARVGSPLQQALAAAGMQLSDIDSVILHGGAIRTPFVQKELERVCGSSKVRTSVNADEAAVFGAAFKGAALSPSFRVKDIRANDASGYPVVLKWPSENKERKQKLFTSTSQVGPEKQVTVKNLDDFDFSFFHQITVGDSVVESPLLGVHTQNLTASVGKLKENFGCSEANITTKFSIRLSPVDGLPEVVSGSVSCEVENAKKGIVDDVKGFFGLGSKKDGQEPLGEDGEAKESITLEPEEPQASTTSSADETTSTASAKESKKAVPQIKLESIPISFTSAPLGVPAPSADELARITSRLDAFDTSDRNRFLREEALNELEAFIYRTRDLTEDGEFVKVLKADQLAALKERTTTASDWLYEDGADATTAEFKERLKALKDIVNPALKRKSENADRPARVETLQDALKNAKTVIDVMQKQIDQDEELYSSSASASSASATESSSTTSSSDSASTSDSFEDLEEDPYASSSSTKTTTSTKPQPTGPRYSVFQPSDLTGLTKTYESTNTWFEEQLAAQEKLTISDDPVLVVAEIELRLKELQRNMNRIYEKMGAAAARSGKGSSKDQPPKKNDKKEKEAEKEQKPKKDPNYKDEL